MLIIFCKFITMIVKYSPQNGYMYILVTFQLMDVLNEKKKIHKRHVLFVEYCKSEIKTVEQFIKFPMYKVKMVCFCVSYFLYNDI